MTTSYLLIGLVLLLTISLVSILSWIVISARGHWSIKAGVVLITLILSLGTVLVWRDLQGTPKLNVDLEGMVIRGYLIKEPKGIVKGKIWLWVTDPKGSNEPLNVELPYSKRMHKLLSEDKDMKKGHQKKLKRGKGDPTKKGTDNDSEEGQWDLELLKIEPEQKIVEPVQKSNSIAM